MTKKQCLICKKEFNPTSAGDLYCGVLCLNASISDIEQEDALKRFADEPLRCPICKRNKKYLVHKRMNGLWYLYQRYHFNNNRNETFSCYYCNLWEMNFRKRTGLSITPEEHSILINKNNQQVSSYHIGKVSPADSYLSNGVGEIPILLEDINHESINLARAKK